VCFHHVEGVIKNALMKLQSRLGGTKQCVLEIDNATKKKMDTHEESLAAGKENRFFGRGGEITLYGGKQTRFGKGKHVDIELQLLLSESLGAEDN